MGWQPLGWTGKRRTARLWLFFGPLVTLYEFRELRGNQQVLVWRTDDPGAMRYDD